MVDLIPFAARLLEQTGAQLELSYSDFEAELPLIVLSEADNSSAVISEGGDLFSTVTLQTDIYDETEERARRLSIEVSGIMTKAGFRRSVCQMIQEENIKRCMMRFTAAVDENSRRLYSSGV